MSVYLPVMLDCKGRCCAVVGGGAVAERKVNSLLAASADVTVISPEVTQGLRQLVMEGRIRWISREYAAGDLAGAFLVYAATSSPAVNGAVIDEAERMGALANAAGGSRTGSFISPSVLRRGRLVIAVSTSGAGPALAAEICDRLEEEYGPEYEEYLEWMYRMRSSIKRQVTRPETRQRLLMKAAELEVLDEIRKGTFEPWDTEQIKQWIANNQEES
ncbi:bifunctional precorrin-2 dehydrogenase/sirohydrochlorin ferrochelatase [Paenibacillus sp. PSB04]|uniref:precorrin-2 dehydrogenase/sirohydrochlorin ferrochelatase family protein n=1 Tax=Paenibacillus sp. PSB04 TaxID=2866810 RepID=UPI0021F0E4CF